MSITYTYRIINVDVPARCMEVVYSADGHQTMHIGARLPYEGEALEDVVRQYAPVAYWEEQTRSVLHVEVGAEGTITPIVAPVVSEAPTTATSAQPTQVGAQTL